MTVPRKGRRRGERAARPAPGEFVGPLAPEEIRREKARARALRGSAWWKRRVAPGRCAYCDRTVGPRRLTMDHRIPLVRGGRSTRANLLPACKPCNTAKKSLLPIEWDAYLARLAAPTDPAAPASP